MGQGDEVRQEPVDEFRMRQMLEHLPFFAVMIDRERRYVWVNRLDPTLTLDQVIGHKVDDFVHPSSRSTLVNSIERAFTAGEVGKYEARGYGEGDVATWYGTTVVPLPPNERGDERALLLSNDVTKQHVAEEALQASERRFRVLTESSPDRITIVNHEQRVVYLNRDPPADTGLTREEVEGMLVAELTHPDYVETAAATIQRVLDTGEPGRYEAKGSRDERTYVCRVVRLSLTDRKAQVLITATDVTAQRQADVERAELEARLQQSQKLEGIGQLAGGVAHDFNNLLLVIHNHLEFAAAAVRDGGDPLPELEAIRMAADRAQEVTGGLLTIGRRQPRQPRVFDLCGFARNSMRLLRRMIPESVDVELEIEEEPLRVDADTTQVEQVLMNLCLNARDAIEGHGSIRVRIGRATSNDEHDPSQLRLTISDNGCGMNPATIARAFEPFFTTKPTGEGTGLGLSMVHSLVTQNGGRVALESEERQGTVVTVLLPEARDGSHVAEPQARSEPASRKGSETILVAEDEPLVRQIVVRVLKQAGYHVLEAENGRDAVNAFIEHGKDIDLVLLDAVMPRLGGKDAYEEIAKLRPDVKVLFSSGYSAETLPQPFLDSQGLTVLSKPYRPSELLAAIQEVLEQR